MLNDCLPLLGIASTCSRLRRGANRDGRAPVDRCEPRQPAEEIAGGRPRHGRVGERSGGTVWYHSGTISYHSSWMLSSRRGREAALTGGDALTCRAWRLYKPNGPRNCFSLAPQEH